MRSSLPACLLLLLAPWALSLLSAPSSSANDRVVAFVNVNVIPMDQDRLLIGQTVIVRRDRIVYIGPADKAQVPATALRIPGNGRYLIPGLADMHIHLWKEEATNLAILQLLVANGVTTALNMEGIPEHLELRRRIAEGRLLAPTLFTTGPYISETSVIKETPTPEEVEREVVAQKLAGYDFIKIHGSFTREAYQRLFQVARREGIRVIGHLPRNLGIQVAFEEHQDMIAHAEEYLNGYFKHDFQAPSALTDLEAQQNYYARMAEEVAPIARATSKAQVWVTPTLTIFYGIAPQVEGNLRSVLARPEVKYIPPNIYSVLWQPGRNQYEKKDKALAPVLKLQSSLLSKLVRSLQQTGVPLLSGTDSPVCCLVPGFSLHDELKNMVAAGLTPYEALRTSTANPATFLGACEEFGTIAVGKRADLVLLEANPLKDISNTSKQAGVMLRGRWIPDAEIKKMQAQLLDSYRHMPLTLDLREIH